MVRSRRFFVAALSAVLWLPVVGAAGAEAPKNVILFIGDGMGFEQVKASSLYAAGKEGALAFEPYYKGEVTTHSLDAGRPTDSSAAATALATGHKTANGMVGRTPDGKDLQTILEYWRDRCKATGLVTTVPMTHATPACFAAHVDSRNDPEEIASWYFGKTRPNVLFGACDASGKGVTPEKAARAGYAVVKTRAELAEFVRKAKTPKDGGAGVRVSGQFASGQIPFEYDGGVHRGRADVTYKKVPHLEEMTTAAIDLLGRAPKGFFLMVEGGAIDFACHENNLERSVGETLEFAKAFRAARDWARDRGDTLIIVTADHETGGLKVVKARARGEFPEVVWATKGHSNANVPIYATGPGAERLRSVVDNTALFAVMSGEASAGGTPREPPAHVKEKQEALTP